MPKRVSANLEILGENADEVANSLRVLGIKGEPNEPWRNPVYYYLQAKKCAVSIGVMLGVGYANVGDVVVQVPPAVSEFILKFDAGDYPDLER